MNQGQTVAEDIYVTLARPSSNHFIITMLLGTSRES